MNYMVVLCRMGDFQVGKLLNQMQIAFHLKLVPSPHIIASVQVHSNFKYGVTIPRIKSHVSCVSDMLLVLRTVDQLYMCEGNLCSEFSEVVKHNEGKFFWDRS